MHRSPYTGTDRRIDPCSAPQGVRESGNGFPGSRSTLRAGVMILD
jgi:hypothetical protein